MRRLPSLLALGFGLLPGCSCGDGNKQAPGDAAVYEVNFEAPAGCPPAQANDKGVGRGCTKGGGQCASPLHCTCDPYLGVQLDGVPCVCTLVQLAQTGATDPCAPPLPADFCGLSATCCAYLTSAAYCVPDICLPGGQCVVFEPVDAGVD